MKLAAAALTRRTNLCGAYMQYGGSNIIRINMAKKSFY